jgi:hypothetical protein
VSPAIVAMLFVRDLARPSALLGNDPDRCEGGV